MTRAATKPAKTSQINPELDTYLKQLLEEVMAPAEEGEPKPSLTDKMKVVDRILKWEQIKGKLKDGDWGAGFEDSD